MLLITENEMLAYVLVFFGEIALNLNWAIVADILLVSLYVFTIDPCFSTSDTILTLFFQRREEKNQKPKR